MQLYIYIYIYLYIYIYIKIFSTSVRHDKKSCQSHWLPNFSTSALMPSTFWP